MFPEGPIVRLPGDISGLPEPGVFMVFRPTVPGVWMPRPTPGVLFIWWWWLLGDVNPPAWFEDSGPAGKELEDGNPLC